MATRDCPECEQGEIDSQGYCTVCGEPSLVPVSPQPQPPASEASRPVSAPDTRRESVARLEPWWGLSLIDASTAPPGDESMDTVPLIPEQQRSCPNGHQVKHGWAAGFCTTCGKRYDFTRPRPFQTISDRYEVYRKLGAGSFGSALLAYDRNLGTDVVLKDLTESVASTAVRERNALVGLRHDSIVRIYGFEPEGPYLVLEYVRGTPLSPRADDRLEVILGHGLQILQALDYLHARGLLHADVKPENIIRFGEQSADGLRDRVRLIDFGAVRELGKPGPVDIYTRRYAPLKTDPEHEAPTAGFDLFCLGRTLQDLCDRHLRNKAAPGVAALALLLARATDLREPGRRFVSARQFAEQLSGVIRQVAAHEGRRIARPSAVFGPVTEPLHGGLAAPRPLGHWVGATMQAGGVLTMAAPFDAPAPADIVAALPTPLADPDEPAVPQASEARLIACRSALTEARLPAWSWVRAWYSGLIAAASGDISTAVGDFRRVRDTLPGELIPLIALGLCEEISGRRHAALQFYQTTADSSPALSAAGFGLARMLILAGRRNEAVAVTERLASELQAGGLRSEQDARIATVRLLTVVGDHGAPAGGDLDQAQEIVDGFRMDPDVRAGLDAEIQYARSRATGNWLALSEQIRRLAPMLASTKPDYFAMIDVANRLRPAIKRWPRWQRARGHAAT